MAKKQEKIKVDDFDMDFDFDDNWDDGDVTFNPAGSSGNNSRNPVLNSGKTVLKSMGETALTPEFMRESLRAALPKEFSTSLDNFDKYSGDFNRMRQDINKELRPTLNSFKQMTRTVNRLIPNPFQSKIEKYFADQQSNKTADMNVDLEQAAVDSQLGDVFQQQEQADRNQAKAEKVIDRLSQEDFRSKIYEAVDAIRVTGAQQNAYQMSVQRSYQKKSLEIRIRQLVTTRGILDVTRKSAEESSQLLRDIVKNTGLPEFAKEEASEHFHRLARQRLFGTAQESIGEFMKNYLSKVSTGYVGLAKEKLGEFRGFFDQGRQFADDIELQAQQMRDMGMDPKEMALELFGQNMMQRVGTKAGMAVAKHLPYKQEMSNFFGYGNEFMTNLAPNMRKLARSQEYGSLKHTLLRPWDQSHSDGGIVRAGGLNSLTGGNDMEMRKVRALEEILPGYLSRILHSIDIMRTGDANIPRTVFSGQKGAFVQFNEAVSLVRKSALNDSDIESQQSYVNDLIGQIDPRGRLRGKDKDVLTRHLMHEMHGVNAYDPAALANEGVEGLSKNGKKNLAHMLKTRYDLQVNDKGKLHAHMFKSRNDLRDQDSQIYKRGQDRIKAMRPTITGITNSGDMEAAIAEGLVIWDGTNWVMNDGYQKERAADFRRKSKGTPRTDPGAPTGGLGDLRGLRDRLGTPPIGEPTPTPPPVGGLGGALRNLRGGDDSISPKGSKNIVRAIQDQTEQILAYMEPKSHTDHTYYQDMVDAIDEIGQMLDDGITVNGSGGHSVGAGAGGGGRRGLLRRGVSRARKGATWAGKKLWSLTGAPFKAMNWLRKKVPGMKAASWMKNKLVGGLRGLGIGGKIDRLRSDVYVLGTNGFRRALDMAGFTEGRYVDMKTGKPITSVKDITGAVYDNTLQKQVISEEEFQAGLLNSVGQRIKDGLVGRATAAFGKVSGWVTSPITNMWKTLGKTLTAGKQFLLAPPDIYVLGETSPRIKGDLFYKGMYYSGVTGKPLKTLGDIDGDIITFDSITGDRKVVITKEEIEKGLYDSKGRPLTPLLRKFKNAVSWVGGKVKGLFTAPKRMLDWAKNGIKGLGNGMKSLLGGGAKDVGQTFWLKRIFRLLYNQFTGAPLGDNLTDALQDTGVKVADAAKKMSQKAGILGGKLWRKGKDKAEELAGSDSVKRANGYANDLKERSGSWFNRQLEKGKTAYRTHQAGKPAGEKKGGIFDLLKNGFGLIGGVLMSIKSGFKSFGAKLFGWLPKLLMAKRGADALGDAADVLGNGGRRGGLLGKLGRGALKVGKFALGAGGMAVRGAMWAGSALASVASLPVVLGVAAAVGVGYLIYKGWKAYSERVDVMQRMRLAQYGADLGDKEECGKILAFEETIRTKYTRIDGNGEVTIQPLPYPELMSAFGINAAAKFAVHNWVSWFDRRFKPVFTKNVQELYKVDPKADLCKSGSYANGLKPKYAKATKIEAPANTSPYFIQQSPFPNQTSRTGTTMVDATIAAVVAEYSEAEKTYRAKDALGKGVDPQAVLGPRGEVLKATSLGNDATIQGQKLTYSAGPNNRILDQMGGLGDRATMARLTGDQATDDALLKNNRIDDLTSIRLKAYGLRSLDRMYVDILTQLERDVYQNVTVATNGVASYNGNVVDAYGKYCSKFGLAFSDTDARVTWETWFEHRFLPVFLNFVAQSKKIDPNQDPFLAWQRFKAADLLKIANFVSDAKSTFNGQRISIWAINVSPFPGESAGTDASVIQPNLEVFKQAQDKEKYQESEAAGRAIREKYTGVKVNDPLSDKGRSKVESKVNDLMADMAKATGNTAGYQVENRAVNGYGTSFEAAGTGGMYGSGKVPKVKLSGSAKQHADNAMAFAQANGIAGEELALFMGTLAHESGNFAATLEKGSGTKYEGNKNLGNDQPGDGERFKGRGWIQLTGRANYAHYGKLTGLDLLNHPELAELPENANKLAVAYWQDRVVPLIRKKRAKFDVLSVARAVNGWFENKMPNGMDDRVMKTEQWRKIITEGGDAPLSNRGAVEAPGGQVQGANGGQETTPALPKGAVNPYDSVAQQLTTPKGGGGGGQETVPSINNAATDVIPQGKGQGLQNLKTINASSPTLQPQANPTSEMVDHRRLQVARSTVEGNAVRQTQQAVTEQAKASGSAVEILNQQLEVQTSSRDLLQKLVDILQGQPGDRASAPAPAATQSTAEKTMNSIPVKSGVGAQPGGNALPFGTRRGNN